MKSAVKRPLNFALLFCVLGAVLLFSCNNSNSKEPTQAATQNKTTPDLKIAPATVLLEKTIEAHGGERYKSAHYSFVFRNKKYTFRNNDENYTYTRETLSKSEGIVDSLSNGHFSRHINKQAINLSNKDIDKHSEAINSVIYFATLPHKLNDPAVKKKHLGSTSIKNETCNILEINFEEEGGGKDFDDVFQYWINTQTHKIDYLAYSYNVNGGGVRFRSAYNTRIIDGITFQDYVNYKAPIGTPLKDLPSLFERNELKELSRIETENIHNLKPYHTDI